MKKCAWLLILTGMAATATAQLKDTSAVTQTMERILNEYEALGDSTLILADEMEAASKRLNYTAGITDAIRARGLYYDWKEDYNSAQQQYLSALQIAEQKGLLGQQSALCLDIMGVYLAIQQLDKAKSYAFRAIHVATQAGKQKHIAVGYSNLGIVYRRQEKYDSAYWSYQQALRIKEAIKDTVGIINTSMNIGSLLVYMEAYSEALRYFDRNLAYHLQKKDSSSLWFDYSNKGGVLVKLKQYQLSQRYLDTSLVIAKALQSKAKEAQVYELYSELYREQGDYKLAYDFLQKGKSLKSESINEETSKAIAALEEKYKAEKREQQNKLLTAEVEQQKLQKRNTRILAAAAAMVAALIAFALFLNRRKNARLQEKNELISRQNDKLAELNFEKNSLISIVSHDLSGPFANIKLWSEVLRSDPTPVSPVQQDALTEIGKSALYGEKLIRNILDVEKAETSLHRLSLERFDLKIYTEDIVKSARPSADKKSIQLHYDSPEKSTLILSDKQMVSRIVENLLSNAIKYTPPGKNVWVSISEENDAVRIQVRDEGVGIEKDELPRLFSRYQQLSSKPTAGEDSTGLGLSIVKRIVDELNGKIFAESEPGKGSLFTVVLRK
jgi:signal transduction histidine kinase